MLSFFKPISQLKNINYFQNFTLCHLIYLIIIASIMFVLIKIYKNKSMEQKQKLMNIFCILLPTFNGLRMLWEVYAGQFSIANSLPFHLCSFQAIITILLVITKNDKFVEFLYAFGLSGATAAVLFPNLTGYPQIHYYTAQFFINHGVIIFIPLFYMVCMGFCPQIKNLWFSGLILAFLIPFDIVFNNIFGANYMFLAQGVPGTPLQLVEQITGKHLYLLGVAIFGLIILAGMYAPFVISDLIKRKQSAVSLKQS